MAVRPDTAFRFAAPTHIGRTLSLALAAVVVNACSLHSPYVPADPRVDFTAHSSYRGLAVDQMAAGRSATIVAAETTPVSGGPTHVFPVDGGAPAGLWMADRDHLIVRRTLDVTAPLTGEILASRRHGAIQLTFLLADGRTFHTSRFHRVESDNFPRTLNRELFDLADLPGVFRTELRDAAGVAVGWLSVRILPYQGLPREYRGDVPQPLNGPIAAGAVALVDSEIHSIIDRNAFPGDRIPEGLAP